MGKPGIGARVATTAGGGRIRRWRRCKHDRSSTRPHNPRSSIAMFSRCRSWPALRVRRLSRPVRLPSGHLNLRTCRRHTLLVSSWTTGLMASMARRMRVQTPRRAIAPNDERMTRRSHNPVSTTRLSPAPPHHTTPTWLRSWMTGSMASMARWMRVQTPRCATAPNDGLMTRRSHNPVSTTRMSPAPPHHTSPTWLRSWTTGWMAWRMGL